MLPALFAGLAGIRPQRTEDQRPEMTFVRVNEGGHNNIKSNPVFRGMVLRKGELRTKENLC